MKRNPIFNSTINRLTFDKVNLPTAVWGDKDAAVLKLLDWLEAARKVVISPYSNPNFSYVGMMLPVLEMYDGRRYIRVDKVHSDRRSVYAFIDKTNGDILRAAGYKKPAKHARGNIFDQWNGTSMIEPYGIMYLQ